MPTRYTAFLSYSHNDAPTADWLHKALEQFRVPAGLVGQVTAQGSVPKRLRPIFRDRHELAASTELGTEIRNALHASRFLIVLCSPAAAQSRWVDAEVDMFKRERPDGCVIAAIVDGEPFASDSPERAAQECLPRALRIRYDRRGRPTSRRAEPLAADLRDGCDGKRLGLLKIIAGMLGVGLDDLVQRDTLRRQRRLAILAAGSLAGMAVTTTLAVVAIDARDAARDQRREAEGLVGFMLGDLRSKLEPLGRLDVLDAVGARALAYYESQNKSQLSDDSLAQRSKALTLMGEIANTRGNLDAALRLYREALTGTEEALRRSPDEPQRLFDHAQNVFWVGYIAWQRGRVADAERAFSQYKQLAGRMIDLEPNKREWQLEGIYADTNLGVLLLEQRRYREAAARFEASLPPVEALAAGDPSDADAQKQLSETLAYLSEAREKSGSLDRALADRERQLGLIARLGRAHPGDIMIRAQELAARRAAARLMAATGDLPAAIAHATAATKIGEQLFATEPGNTEWMHVGAMARIDLAELQTALGREANAAPHVRAACETLNRLTSQDSSVAEWRAALRGRCLLARAQLALNGGAAADALNIARDAAQLATREKNAVEARMAFAAATALTGDALQRMGRMREARAAWIAARTRWPSRTELTPEQRAQLALLETKLGRSREAQPHIATLERIGYRHPVYSRQIRNGGRA